MRATQLDESPPVSPPASLEQLEEIVTRVGRSPWLWGHAVRFDAERRTHRVLRTTDALEVALFGWSAGQGTSFHDHGGASGAAFVCCGMLIEDVVEAMDGLVLDRHTHMRRAETAFSFGRDYIHRVRQAPSQGVALSIHAYTPAAGDALDYEVLDDGRVIKGGPAPARRRFA
jgi:predicted metal-dependent enzyme (double-stranded beta helix superfamily)